MQSALQALVIFSQVLRIDAGIQTAVPQLDPGKRIEYAAIIASESDRQGIDPMLVVAVIWHESDFSATEVSSSADYGLLQVHWQKAYYLQGITKTQLLEPAVNIRAGISELLFWKNFCHHKTHPWYAHYKFGNVVGNRRYDRAIWSRYQKLTRPPRSKSAI